MPSPPKPGRACEPSVRVAKATRSSYRRSHSCLRRARLHAGFLQPGNHHQNGLGMASQGAPQDRASKDWLSLFSCFWGWRVVADPEGVYGIERSRDEKRKGRGQGIA